MKGVSQENLPTFVELGVAQEIADALKKAGIERTFAIQQLTLPIALAGQDLIGQARTGMGKTFGFGVPLLDRIFDDADIDELDGTPRGLVIVPTRELAIQVGEDLTMAASLIPVRVLTVYGGRPYEEQLEALESGADVVVGTPGRLIDLYHRGYLRLDQVAVLVLDEADEMLDLGFLPDIEKLMAALTHEHQTMLFSATMPGPITTLARSFLNKPIQIRAESQDSSHTHTTTKQVVFQTHRLNKDAVVSRILQAEGRGKTIIFAKTKRSCAIVAEKLAELGFTVGSVHGDMDQQAREKSLNGFKSGRFEILVATDVAARGIDIDDVTHVINYDTPQDPMTYVHRIGRTGRAGHTGVAVTLVGFDEDRLWGMINDELNLDKKELETWFSNSPELYEALNIPEHAQDRVGEPTTVFGGRASTRPAGPRHGQGSGRPPRSRNTSGGRGGAPRGRRSKER